MSVAMCQRHNAASQGAPGPWLQAQLDSQVLRRIEVARQGEPTAALLVLWEVRTGRVFPSTATTVSVKVRCFSMALNVAVKADVWLAAWLKPVKVKAPLS